MGYSYFARKRKLFINWRRSVQSVFIHSVVIVKVEYGWVLISMGYIIYHRKVIISNGIMKSINRIHYPEMRLASLVKILMETYGLLRRMEV